MQEFFNAPYQLFTTAILFVFSLAVIEVLLFFVGASSATFVEDASLDSDLDMDLDLDFDLEVTPDSIEIFEMNSPVDITPASFFNIGKIPFFVILMTLGFTFGFFGIWINKMALSLGMSLPLLLSVPLSVGFSAIATWGISNVLKKILPGDSSYAITEESFVAREAVVEDGVGNSEKSVMISFVDEFDVKHNLLGTVAIDGISVQKGQKVVILNKNHVKGGFFILPSFEALAEMKVNANKSMSMTKS